MSEYYEEIGATEYALGPLGLSAERFLDECRDLVVLEKPFEFWGSEGEVAVYLLAKEGVDTPTAARKLASLLGAKRVAYAGLKDANALTLQYVTVEAERCPPLVELPWGFARLVGRARRHLKRGYLQGNAFAARLKDPKGFAVVSELLERGRSLEVYNYFGPQRFGTLKPLNHELGELVLRRDFASFKAALEAKGGSRGWERLVSRARSFEEAARLGLKWVLELLVSSFQAWVFNFCLSLVAREAKESLLERPYGALPGAGLAKLRRPWVNEAHLECAMEVLRERGLGEGSFSQPGLEARAGVRPMLVKPSSLKVSKSREGFAAVAFELPPGSYAFSLLRELFGSDDRWVSKKCARRALSRELGASSHY